MYLSLVRPLALVCVILLSACASRTAKLKSPGPASTAGTTIEASDLRLGAALLTATILPNAQSELQVAREYERLGILDMAEARAARALARNPRSAPGQEFMARVWRDWQMPVAALPYAYRAVAYAPQSASAHNTLGTILDALGHSDGARESYKRALAIDLSADYALNNLCHLDFKLGRLADARLQCEAALAISPGLTPARNNLGLIFAAMGHMDRASETFLGAEDPAAAHYNIGIVYLSDHRYKDAARAFEQAISARPGFTAAKRWAHEAHMHALALPDAK
jgi:tetratricopeptide (TPR) repeat protein